MLTSFRKLYNLFDRRDKRRLLGLYALMFIGALLDMIGVGVVPAFVAALAVPDQLMAHPLAGPIIEGLGIGTGRDLVFWGAGAMLLIYLVKSGFVTLVYYLQTRTTEYASVYLARRAFKAYMRAPYTYILNNNTSVMLRNVYAETREVVTGVLNPILQGMMAAMMLVFILALLIVATPGIALVSLGLLGVVVAGFLSLVQRRIRVYGAIAQQSRAMMIKDVNQGLGSFVDARILGREDHFVQAFRKSNAQFARSVRLKQFINAASTPIMEIAAVAGLLLTVVVLLWVSDAEPATLLPIAALLGAAVVRLRATSAKLVATLTQIRYSLVAVDAVADTLLELEALSTGDDVRKGPPMRFEHSIELDRISYCYPGVDVPALNSISLTIEKGSSVAFVGSTGSGKTTLANVILGLLTPQEGSIRVDGVDVRPHMANWQSLIGYIPQVIFLLDDSIRQNVAIALRDDEIDDAQVWKALEAAQLDEYVRGLEDGLDTIVGERGVRMSGGQRQRVGLARALYHNPPVLVMDEATSSLDNQTENLVMDALATLRDGRTFIMIAHRLSTVKHCDQLYFMKAGSIQARGTFDELSDTHEDFQRMADLLV